MSNLKMVESASERRLRTELEADERRKAANRLRCPIASKALELVMEAIASERLSREADSYLRNELGPELNDLASCGVEISEARAVEVYEYVVAQTDQSCGRWGQGADRCIKLADHLGQCEDAKGATTMSLTAQYLGLVRK